MPLDALWGAKLILSLLFICREDSPTVVDVILTRRAEFSAYASYISDYDHSMSVLEESCRQNKAFEDVVKQFEVRFMAGCIYDK